MVSVPDGESFEGLLEGDLLGGLETVGFKLGTVLGLRLGALEIVGFKLGIVLGLRLGAFDMVGLEEGFALTEGEDDLVGDEEVGGVASSITVTHLKRASFDSIIFLTVVVAPNTLLLRLCSFL